MFTSFASWRNHFFNQPNVENVARRELREAQLALLEAQTGKEYAEAMVRYQENRVRRLTNFIQTRGSDE